MMNKAQQHCIKEYGKRWEKMYFEGVKLFVLNYVAGIQKKTNYYSVCACTL